MGNVYPIILLIVLHYIGDFLLQTREMANNKSKDNEWLALHVLAYSMVFFFGMILFYDYFVSIIFMSITFVCHFFTDYVTSRLTSYCYKKNQIYNFFAIMGFDQVLHLVQLILTLKLIQQL